MCTCLRVPSQREDLQWRLLCLFRISASLASVFGPPPVDLRNATKLGRQHTPGHLGKISIIIIIIIIIIITNIIIITTIIVVVVLLRIGVVAITLRLAAGAVEWTADSYHDCMYHGS